MECGNWPPKACLFMKIGPHGPESLDDILARKSRELKATGRIFWGYGGNILHPRTQARPFVEKWVQKQGSVYLLMEQLQSPARNRVARANTATHYSEDKAGWWRLSASVETGPDYALLIDKIESVGRELDLRDYRVGIGDSKNTNAAGYIRHRVDKGAFVRAEKRPDHPPKLVTIAYRARLLEPYAVFLR